MGDPSNAGTASSNVCRTCVLASILWFGREIFASTREPRLPMRRSVELADVRYVRAGAVIDLNRLFGWKFLPARAFSECVVPFDEFGWTAACGNEAIDCAAICSLWQRGFEGFLMELRRPVPGFNVALVLAEL